MLVICAVTSKSPEVTAMLRSLLSVNKANVAPAITAAHSTIASTETSNADFLVRVISVISYKKFSYLIENAAFRSESEALV